jgi:DNA gyrase subunit B
MNAAFVRWQRILLKRLAQFYPCRQHAPDADAELFIVEGDSAAQAVAAVRNPALQAVLALQGKPVNAARASAARVGTSPWLAKLTALLGDAPGTALPLGELRYRRLLLLMDPDADGIHAGALLLIFLYQHMRALIDEQKVYIVHAPWAEIRRSNGTLQLSYHAAEFQQQSRAARAAGACQIIRYRGLGTITPEILARECVASATRRQRVLTMADAENAAAVFGASRVGGE